MSVQAATAWYSGAWNYRVAITIDHTKVAGPLTNFPVLINLTNSALQSALSSGNDLLFTSSDGTTKLAHEIESFASSTGALAAWVNVPGLSAATNTVLYLYYGNASAVNQQNATAVWDSGYVGVWHLQQTPTGSTGDLPDSTSNNNDGTSQTIPSGAQAAGKVGGSLALDGVGDYVSTANSFNNPVTVTVQAWVKTTSTTGTKVVGFESGQIQTNTTASASYDRHIYVGTDGKARFGTYNAVTSSANIATSTNAVNDGQWHFLVGCRDNVASNVLLYVDGVLQQTISSSAGQSYVGWYRIGCYSIYSGNWPSGASGYFAGDVDEIRVSHTNRSPAWIATEYSNQSSPGAFHSVGSQQMASAVPVTHGDLIVDLRSADLNASASVWTNRASNANAVGNFTPLGGGKLSVATNGGYKALYVNTSSNNALQSALISPAEINGAGSCSVEAWVYATSVTPTSADVAWGIGNLGSGYQREFNYDTSAHGAMSGWFADAAWNTVPATGLWKYLVYTYDGTTLRIYQNGTLDNTNKFTLNTQTQTNILVGSHYMNNVAGGDAFAGYIAAARVMSGVLSASEIADNYSLGIAAQPVTITAGITVNSRTYDGTTNATLTLSNVVLSGVFPGDAGNVQVSTNGYTATFASAGVGSGLAVTVSGLTLTGSAASCYTLTQPTGLTANITAAPLTIASGTTANSKTYDRTTTASIASNNVALSGVVAADTTNVSLITNGYTAVFSSASVANGKAVTVSGLTLAGSAAGNYTLTQPTLTANITAAPVTIASGIAGNSRTYDGTTTATITSNNVALSGVLAGDTANVWLLTNGYTAMFSSAVVANGKTITVSGLTLAGSAAGNYTLTQPTLTANITAAPVTIASGISGNSKTYDRTTTATITSNNVALNGVLAGDTANVSLFTNGYAAVFSSASVANGKTVTVSGLTLAGSAAGNYALTQPTLTANITAAPVTITSGISGNSKTYDGATAATITSNNVALSGVLAGDTANVWLLTNGYTAMFFSASVANGKTVTVSGLTLAGSAAGNYALTQPTTSANITAASTLNGIISSLNPALPGSNVTFTATISVVSPGSGTPTGSVIFKDGTTVLGTVALNGAAVAALSTTTLSHGTHTISTEYAGDGNFFGSTNTLSQSINTRPVAANVSLPRYPTAGVKMRVATLLASDLDADGDTLTLSSVSATSVSNGVVAVSGAWVIYTPPNGFTNTDSFTYVITDGGLTATGVVSVTLVTNTAQSLDIVALTSLGGNASHIQFAGIPGRTYSIQYSESLSTPVWQTLGTATANATGWFDFTDTPAPASPARFYRAVYP